MLSQKNQNLLLKTGIVLAYAAMVTVNYLANALPIGGVTTGEASDAYANLFTPAGITFAIWGLIYTLLLVYVIYTWGWFGKKPDEKQQKLLNKVGGLFIISSLANIAWIFAWHYGIIVLSVLIMLGLLITLIKLADLLNKPTFSWTEKICLRWPFSIYFGWITVATIANITVFLVSINWSGWGISDQIWTIIILLVGALIGITRAIKDKNIPYLLVLVWAYGGIWLKHGSATGYASQYPNIIATLIGCIMLFLITVGWMALRGAKKIKS